VKVVLGVDADAAVALSATAPRSKNAQARRPLLAKIMVTRE
jgi:hypothetical protein